MFEVLLWVLGKGWQSCLRGTTWASDAHFSLWRILRPSTLHGINQMSRGVLELVPMGIIQGPYSRTPVPGGQPGKQITPLG